MGNVWTLTRKELRQMFLSPIAYAFIIVFTAILTFFFFRTFFLFRQASMQEFFRLVPLAMMVLVPGIVMRMWAEERSRGTLEFLLTSPVEPWQVVVSKFLAGSALVTLCMLLTLYVPYTVASYGDLDPGPVWGGYVGSILMGAACVAIGMFCSAFTSDQIVSFLASALVIGFLILGGHWLIQSGFEPGDWMGRVLRIISPTTYFESLGRGVIDLRDVYFYLAIIVVFLYLNTRAVDYKRWR
ncbi:MAG: ABC transporter permease [Planctomycetota bacterium]